MRLYHAPASSSSWRVRIVLALKQVEYESVLIDFFAGDQRAAGFVRSNPLAQVPCLEVDGESISQSVAIAEYLDECYPDPPLLPAAHPARTRVRRIVEVINSGIQPLHNNGLDRSFARAFGATADAILSWKRFWLDRRCEALETLVAHYASEFSVEDSLSLADVFVFPQLERARAFGVDVDSLPTLRRLEEKLSTHSAFVSTAPQVVAERALR